MEQISHQRISTGAVQFADDWPGVFIRGDDSLGFKQWVEKAAERLRPSDGRPLLPDDAAMYASLQRLAKVLGSCCLCLY